MRYHRVSKFVILLFLCGALFLYKVFNAETKFPMIRQSNTCPLRDIITVREGGRFGNCIFEYASAVLLGNLLNLSPYMPRSILDCLDGVFQNLSALAYEDTLLSDHCRMLHGGNIAHCKIPEEVINGKDASRWDQLCNTLKIVDPINKSMTYKSTAELKEMHGDGRLGDVVVLPAWTAHVESILSSGVDKFRQLFHLRNDILDLVKKTISGVLKTADIVGEVSLVGVHVRRKDYIPYLVEIIGNSTSFVTPAYHKRAMNKMRMLRPSIFQIFVIVSDDREWCMKDLVNESDAVFWGGMEGSPFHAPFETQNTYIQSSHDFGLLASLNDSIISYGTYAVSAALLAGGHTIAFDVYQAGLTDELNIFTLGKHLENWEYMK